MTVSVKQTYCVYTTLHSPDVFVAAKRMCDLKQYQQS